jgi:hypothetical protein
MPTVDDYLHDDPADLVRAAQATGDEATAPPVGTLTAVLQLHHTGDPTVPAPWAARLGHSVQTTTEPAWHRPQVSVATGANLGALGCWLPKHGAVLLEVVRGGVYLMKDGSGTVCPIRQGRFWFGELYGPLGDWWLAPMAGASPLVNITITPPEATP